MLWDSNDSLWLVIMATAYVGGLWWIWYTRR